MKYILLLSLFILTGCSATPTVSQRVGLVSETYITTNNSMTVLARSGNLSLDTAETYESYRSPVEGYLQVAFDDLLDGRGEPNKAESALDLLIPLLDRMIEASERAKNE